MKQILEDLRTGAITVEEVPAPQLRPGCVLVRNHFSAISAGTEAATVMLGKKSLLGKAMARPEQVQKVINVVRTQGLMTAYRAATRSLDMPIPLGYSSAGEVIEVAAGIDGLAVGDLVACSGAPYAYHAEIVCVPRNLCVRIPAGVDTRHAAFGTVGAIALNALRVGQFALGERVVIIGLGLLGLLATHIARAAGCQVFGIDPNPRRRDFFASHNYGIAAPPGEEAARQVLAWTGGEGADLIVITASTTDNQPVALAGQMARRRGRVVVVGRTEMTAPRETYLFKELKLLTSFSCGPGADDPGYELALDDYPGDLVRWSERRNVEAFVELAGSRKVNLAELVSHEFPIDRAPEAFDLITGGGDALAVVLAYPQSAAAAPAAPISTVSAATAGKLRIGVIGAGSHATNEVVPLLAKRAGVQLRGISSATGVRAAALAKRYGFAYCDSAADRILEDGETDAVLVLTRHDTHAEFAAKALRSGKHVLVEKPLALTLEQLELVVDARRATDACLMVGFNRRYAPVAQRLREMFRNRTQPMSISYRANVGYRPPQHWLHHPQQGGGVLLGEACHYVDFCCWLTGSAVVEHHVAALPGRPPALIGEDNLHISLRFADGSLASIQYLSNGDTSLPREQVEVFCERRSVAMSDFRRLHRGDAAASRWWPSLGSDWGHSGLLEAFVECARGGRGGTAISESMLHSSRITIELNEQLLRRSPME